MPVGCVEIGECLIELDSLYLCGVGVRGDQCLDRVSCLGGALLTRLPSEFGELSKLIRDQASRLELFVLTGIAKPYDGVMLGWLL